MIQNLLNRTFRQAGVALTALSAQIASAHEGHGALGELHAHGDSLWTLALLAAAVVIALALGARK